MCNTNEIYELEICGEKHSVLEYTLWNKVLPDGSLQRLTVKNECDAVFTVRSNEKAVYTAEFYVENDTRTELVVKGISPFVTMIDADIIRDFSAVDVKKGTHRLSVEYVNGEPKDVTTSLLLVDKNKISAPGSSCVKYAAEPFKHDIFASAEISPSVKMLEAAVFGVLYFADVNGAGALVEQIGKCGGANIYRITVGNILKTRGVATLYIKPFVGYVSGAIFAGPVKTM